MLTKRRVYSSRLWARPLGVLGFSWASTCARGDVNQCFGVADRSIVIEVVDRGSAMRSCRTLGVCDLTLPVRATVSDSVSSGGQGLDWGMLRMFAGRAVAYQRGRENRELCPS